MARDVRAGGAYVELGLRAKLDKGIQKASAKMRAFGTSIAKIGGAVAGAGVGAVAPLIMAAATAEEVGSKFDTVFGNNAESVRKWGDEFADQVGRSRTDIARFLSSSQDLFVPLGFDSDAAESMSKEITGLALDLASFNNMTDADAMNDLQAALTGSGEVMKKYGVVLSEAGVKQELLNKGIDPANATNAQKAQARYNIILQGTTAAQGDALRTGSSFTNQMKALWGSVNNVAVALGSHLLPPATFAVGLFNRAAKAVMTFADANPTLTRNVLYVVAAVTAAAGAIAGIGVAVMSAGVLFPILYSGVTAVAGALSFLLGPGLLAAGVIATVGSAAYAYRDSIVEWGEAFWEMIKPVRDAMSELWSIVSGTFGGISDAITAGDYKKAVTILWRGIKTLFFTGASQALQALSWLRERAVDTFRSVSSSAGSILGGIWDSITSGAASAVSMIGSTFAKVVELVGTPFRAVLKLTGSLGTTIAGIFQTTFDWLKDALSGLFENFKTTFGGIVSAISAGKIGLAAEILWASIELAFATGIGAVKKLWSSFTLGLTEVWSGAIHGIVDVFRTMVSSIVGLVEKSLQGWVKITSALAEYDPTGTLSSISQGLGSAADFADVMQQDITARQKAAEDARNREQLTRGKKHLADIEAIEKKTAAARERRDNLVQQAKDAGGEITIEGLKTSSIDKLKDLLADVKLEADAVSEKAGEVEQQKGDTDSAGDQVVKKTKGGNQVTGTFSAAGAALLGLGGRNSAAEQTAEHTKKMSFYLERIAARKGRVIDQPKFT